MEVQFNNSTYELVIPNIYGLKHDNVGSHFGGDISHIADLQHNNDVYCFYYAGKPDVSKGHHNILMLCVSNGKTFITGMPIADFQNNHRYQLGRACKKCKQIIYSSFRHDYQKCKCGDVMVDGGTDYHRCSVNGMPVRIDFLEKEVSKP